MVAVSLRLCWLPSGSNAGVDLRCRSLLGEGDRDGLVLVRQTRAHEVEQPQIHQLGGALRAAALALVLALDLTFRNQQIPSLSHARRVDGGSCIAESLIQLKLPSHDWIVLS